MNLPAGGIAEKNTLIPAEQVKEKLKDAEPFI